MTDPDADRHPAEAPVTLTPLTGRRRTVYEALAAREPKLAAMYVGAMVVLAQEHNPERLVQCAHSVRELVEKLPRYLDMSVPDEQARLGDKVQVLVPLWEKVTAHPTWSGNDGWIGEIDDVLRGFLKKLREFFAWRKSERPTARERVAKTLRELDPTGQPLPGPIEGLRVEEWLEYREYFQDVAHHRTDPDPKDFESWLAVLDGFLLDRFRPRTFEDQERLRQIISEGENAGS